MASAVERQPVSSRGSVYSGEIENISDDYALTAGTLCNTDHAGIESSEASFPNYPVTYDIATQVVTPSISRQPAVYEDEVPSSSSSAVGDRFNMPLLFCGAQFDTALPESTEDPELEDLIASMDTHRDNTCFKGSPTMSSEVDNATASIIRTESAVDESLLFQDATPPKCSRVDDSHEPRSGTKLPTYEYERPCIVVHDEEGRPVLPVADDLTPFSVCDDSVTPSAIIENTYLLVKILNTQWIPRLASDDKLHEQCKALPVETLFDVGVKTLRKVYLGILPGTFQDLFALMHIAFAFSLIIYRDGNSCYWDGFSRDVYWWHQALGSTTKEAHLFVQVWHLLWCPQVSRRQGVHEDGFHDTGQSRASPATSNGSTCAEPISSCLNPERFPNPNHDTLGHPSQQEPHDMLMDGMVIKGCSRFLDCEIVLDRDQSIPTDLRSDIEYANIQENKTGCFPGLPRSDPRHLVESIVKPLWRCRAVQLAPEHIADTIEKVLKGDLVNVRQVEVTLISCREWTRIPRQAHDTYLNHVAAQCDKADIRSSSSWRNQYYDADLELIISRIVEIRQQRSIILHPVQQTDMLNGEIASMTQSSFGLHSNFHSLIPPESVVKPLLAYGASSCYEYHDSDNPGMHLNTLQNTRRVNPTACSVTESDLLSDGSPSSTQSLTEPSSQTSVDITICPYCSNRSFEGESQNRRRNLRRHMLSEHGVDPRLPCHVAGCPATFKPGRFDNLKRHMKQQHGRDSPPASPTGRKRKAIDL